MAIAVQRKYAVVTVGPHLSGEADRCWRKTWPPETNIEIPEVHFDREVSDINSSTLHMQQQKSVDNLQAACPAPLKSAVI